MKQGNIEVIALKLRYAALRASAHLLDNLRMAIAHEKSVRVPRRNTCRIDTPGGPR